MPHVPGTSYSGTTIDEETYQAEERARASNAKGGKRKGGGWFGGVFSSKGGKPGVLPVRHRRHFRRHHRPRGSPDGGGFGGFFDIANTPSFMLPLFSKLTQEAHAARHGGAMEGQHVERWRKRWDAKYVPGGMGGELARVLSPRGGRTSPPPPSSPRRAAPPPLRLEPPPSSWGVVRERLPDIRGMDNPFEA